MQRIRPADPPGVAECPRPRMPAARDGRGPRAASKGKGQFCYQANPHVPFIIAHPDAKAGTGSSALISHVDCCQALSA
jgi:hypothetical protein